MPVVGIRTAAQILLHVGDATMFPTAGVTLLSPAGPCDSPFWDLTTGSCPG